MNKNISIWKNIIEIFRINHGLNRIAIVLLPFCFLLSLLSLFTIYGFTDINAYNSPSINSSLYYPNSISSKILHYLTNIIGSPAHALNNKIVNVDNSNKTNDCDQSSKKVVKETNINILKNGQRKIINNVLPPLIVMVYNGKEYQIGNLIDAKYRVGIPFTDLSLPSKNITTFLSNAEINIVNGSCLGFVIKNYPLLLPPSSMSITAYDTNGKAEKVLYANKNNTMAFFNVNLKEGKNIFLVVATWLPRSEKVTGYEEYIFIVNIK